MASTRQINSSTEANAHESGAPFDDIANIKDLQKATIHRIVLTCDTFIRSIAIHYAGGPSTSRGELSGTKVEIIMTDGEFITSVYGSINPDAISHLEFVTNKGNRWGPYGQSNPATAFSWDNWGPNMGLLNFSGRVDSHFRILQAHFAAYLPCRVQSNVLRYEKQLNSSLDTPQPDALSTFAKNLMSPTVTLAAGPNGKEINAAHGILCQLPFFRAALEGVFREAAEKRISMPDDDLCSVAALVEYLYTGHYTYPFDNKDETNSDTPTAEIAEGSFHAFVYATAHKYGCEALGNAALTSFLYVLSQLKGIEVVRLWVIAYDQGLVLDVVTACETAGTVMKGLGQLLKGVYTTDREEMDRITADHPTLIGDLLRHVVCAED